MGKVWSNLQFVSVLVSLVSFKVGLEQQHETCCLTPAQCKYTSSRPLKKLNPYEALIKPFTCYSGYVHMT